MRLFLKVILLILFYQSAKAATHTEAWTMFLSQKNWNNYGVNAFTMPRYSFKSDNLYQNLIGASFLYKLNNSSSVALGYLHDVNQSFDLKEKRSFVDILISKSLKSGKILFRGRLESRIFVNNDDRFRFRLMGRYDFYNKISWLDLYPYFSEELLFRLKNQNWYNQQGLAQSRLFTGFRKNYNHGVNLDIALLTIINQRSQVVERFVLAPYLGLVHVW